MPRKKQTIVKKEIKKTKQKEVSRLLGMKDLIPAENIYMQAILEKIKELMETYSFLPIKTPILESINLYLNSFRRGNDKDLYTIEAEKGEMATLRPELTQGIIRSVLENNLDELYEPARLYSLGPIFRREKLQSGRYRESNQLNLEIIGESRPMAEALLITLLNNFFVELNIVTEIQINSIGSFECQKEYRKALKKFFKERGKKSQLCNECKKYLDKDVLAILDCYESSCAGLMKEAPQIADYLEEDSNAHFKKVLEYLDELEISYNFNPYLVRGLSYYNNTVFEFWPVNEKGEASGKLALAGGGRYDEYISKLANKEISGVGLALGIERSLIKAKDSLEIPENNEEIIYIAQLGEPAKLKSMSLFEELRKLGYNVRQSFTVNSLKKQMEEANKLKARVSLILGKKEVMDETIIYRDMESGAQEVIPYKKIKDKLKKINRKEGVLNG
jgi:histidyl-tRNA synthetase